MDATDAVLWARLGRVALARARPVLARRAFERGLALSASINAYCLKYCFLPRPKYGDARVWG